MKLRMSSELACGDLAAEAGAARRPEEREQARAEGAERAEHREEDPAVEELPAGDADLLLVDRFPHGDVAAPAHRRRARLGRGFVGACPRRFAQLDFGAGRRGFARGGVLVAFARLAAQIAGRGPLTVREQQHARRGDDDDDDDDDGGHGWLALELEEHVVVPREGEVEALAAEERADDDEYRPEHHEHREHTDRELAVVRAVRRVLVDVGGER